VISALLHKDFAVSRGFLWIILPFYLLYAAIFFKVAGVYLLVNMAFTLFLSVGVILIDDRYDADLYLLSLPGKRDMLVRARYLSSILVTLAGLLTCLLYGLLLDLIIEKEKMNFDPVASLEGMVAFLVVLLLFLSIFYPLYFRLGPWRALAAMSTLLIILFASVSVILYLGGWVAGKAGFTVPAYFFKDPAMALVVWIARGMEKLGVPLFLAITGLCTLAVVWISIHVSVRLYEKREF